MSYNGSGTFQINTSGQPVVAGTVISSTAFNALTADLATGLSTAITKDGQTTTTARIPFAAGINSSLTTDSSSTSTGSIITAGGVGIAKALYVGTNANVAGTLGVTGVATFSAAPIYSSLTASSAVATDASKGLVSVTNTGTGNNVLATSPTLVTPILGTPASGTLTNCTDLPTTALTGAITEANGGTGTTVGYNGFKNRIINGAMVIDQRNAGASGTGNDNYTVDRWAYFGSQASKGTWQQNAGSVTPPTGFSKYWGFTSSSAYSVGATELFVIGQKIEGFNFSDLAFGSASASTVTISFWVRSSLTGTFGGYLANSSQNRNYPFSYTISSANTWEQKTITIAGDTTGTWIGSTNQIGARVNFSLGIGSTNSTTANAWNGTTNAVGVTGATSVVGTNGATWYVTGVQLEKGSTATSFDVRPYGTELSMCQRYYESTFPIGTAPAQNTSGVNALRVSQTAAAAAPCRGFTWLYKVTKRDTPATITSYNPSAANANVRNNTRSNDATISGIAGLNTMGIVFTFTGSTGSAVGDDNGISFSADAEL